MKKTLLLTVVLLTALANAWAQGPNDTGTYYQSANGLKGKALKTKLASIIVNPRNVGYDGLYEGYKKTDTRPDGYVRDWYSNTTNYRHGVDNSGGYKKEGDSYNREHSVPQSWFSGSGIKSDIVHVLPTDGYVNNRRSNYPFGEVNQATYTSNNGYSKLGSCKTAGYTGTVFEPNDEIKGDIARIYFYMITRYESSCGSWGHDVFTTTYPGLTKWTLDMMMRWSKQDPVDAREIARNNAVYEVQGNRNPYVDYPGLEEYTWGTKMDQPFSYDNYEGTGGSTATVSQPSFSPLGGTFTNQVEVSMSSSTDGAVIYYTTDGTDATTASTRYEAPITLTATTTLKAVAVKDGATSYQTVATYNIVEEGEPEPAQNTTITLNSVFFNTSYSTTIAKANTEDLTGTQNGVSVVYALGSGAQRYSSNQQIRLYPGNELTISVAEGTISKLEFTLGDTPSSSNRLQANTGSVANNRTWTGNAQTVTFTCTGSSGHIKLVSVKVELAQPSAIETLSALPSSLVGQPCYDLQGRRVERPTRGLYIVNGRKILIR